MARYREYSYDQGMLLPISLKDQIQPGTIEHTINFLVDNEIDLIVFDEKYKNDETGAPAIDPAILLKIIPSPPSPQQHPAQCRPVTQMPSLRVSSRLSVRLFSVG